MGFRVVGFCGGLGGLQLINCRVQECFGNFGLGFRVTAFVELSFFESKPWTKAP